MKTKSQPAGTERSAKIKNVIRVSSGNLLEMSFAAVLGLIAALVIPRPENALEDVGLIRQKA